MKRRCILCLIVATLATLLLAACSTVDYSTGVVSGDVNRDYTNRQFQKILNATPGLSADRIECLVSVPAAFPVHDEVLANYVAITADEIFFFAYDKIINRVPRASIDGLEIEKQTWNPNGVIAHQAGLGALSDLGLIPKKILVVSGVTVRAQGRKLFLPCAYVERPVKRKDGWSLEPGDFERGYVEFSERNALKLEAILKRASGS